ncbi:Fibronectin type III domain [Popillia japonica]|uniref:Fibronectin type III domain n=1 Tax=Popillia japonica TaxID=7064 RepID=A0AAW1HU34_POPJA
MDKSFLHIKVISIYLLISAVCRISYSCSGFYGSGLTYPGGDISLEYDSGTPLEITCIVNKSLNEQYPNVSSLLRFMTKDDGQKKPVPQDKIIRLNETSIKFVDKHPEKMNQLYSCELNKSTICYNVVRVGTKPQPVTDFSCIGSNYENLTCSWDPPFNYIPTNYTLSYTFPRVRAGNRVTFCNVTYDSQTKRWKCFWDTSTQPHYRQTQELYNFTLDSSNMFGTLKQTFMFHHFKNIRAAPPVNLTYLSSTTSSLFLRWEVSSSLVPIQRGVHHRIVYQCRFGPKIWQTAGIISTEYKKEVTFNLTGLKYAHDFCDIRVAIRVSAADSEDMWSNNSSVTALTSSTEPGAPPRVNVGSFFESDVTSLERDIYVYWQQVPLEIRNGERFGYDVIVNDDPKSLVHSTSSNAKFSKMSVNTTFKFTIRSKNVVGLSEETAVLVVPAQSDLLGEPMLFTKVSFGDGHYKLSWQEPKIGAQYVENYTLFWCTSNRDRPHICNGYLNWTVVPATTRDHNITVIEEYTTQFAISANNATSSSGMVWASCTLIHNKLITKIKDVWINSMGSRSIQLGWKLDCADRSDSVAGYIIYYCLFVKGVACTKRMNVTISDPHALFGEVTGLMPYKTYMLTVSVINKQGGASLESDPLYNTTYEDVPSEPLNLTVAKVTNSMVTIEWEQPKEPNGYIKHYNIFYNINKTNTSNNNTRYDLYGLKNNTVYNISVSACTVSCSNASIPVTIKTKVGNPGPIQSWAKIENNTLFLRWTKPDSSQEFFEVRRAHRNSDGNWTDVIRTTDTKFPLIDCNLGDKDSFVAKVRAVNQDGNTSFVGPWSEDVEASCTTMKTNAELVWMITTCVSIFVIVVLIFGGKKLYIHYTDMKTIDVKLPPGLDPQIDTTRWTQPKPDASPSDEERLLNKLLFAPPCVDSSGCSSGKESVSSNSGGSISNTSDSGTEQPKTPIDEDPKRSLIEDALSKLSNQRYVPFSEHSVPWSTPSSNGYSLYGLPDSGSPDIELTSVASSKNSVEPSYMRCDQIKTPLRLNIQEHSSPYVMAANKDMMSSLYYPSLPQNSDEKAYVQVAEASGIAKDLEKNEKVQTLNENIPLQNGNGGYVSFGDAPITHLQDTTTVQALDDSVKTNGYVSFGETSVSPTKKDVMHNSKGYVSFGDTPKTSPQMKTSPYIPHRT